MKTYRRSFTAILAAAAVLGGARARADYASSIEQNYSGASYPVTYDNASGAYPVISTVLTSPGTIDGYTYNNYAFLAADSTGSIDMFYSSTASSYVPAAGDAISVSGNYSPFDAIPEISGSATTLAINAISHGNPVPSPVNVTIPDLNVNYTQVQAANGLAGAYAGYYVQLNDVTINSGTATVFPTHANATYSVGDSMGNSMELFFWASSYSRDGAMGGTPIPQGPVNIDGFVDFFGTGATGAAEFIPMSITSAVPEPSVMNLCGLGSVAGWVAYRLRKKA